MEETIRFDSQYMMDTIPLICVENQIQLKKPKMNTAVEIGEYELISLMSVTTNSELWFGKDYFGNRCVVKIVDDIKNVELIQRIRSLQNDNLVQILDCGFIDCYWYEVYPYYENGYLKGIIDEDTIKTIVLPGIISALDCLHEAGIVHNDIKPENIFWDEDHSRILLGDFGCVSEMKERPKGITPAYAAPELLLNDVSRRSSDWASVGLLLAKLISNELLINTKSLREALNIWERGVSFSGGSLSLQRLINGMITTEPRKRLGPNAAKKWCGDAAFGGEERISVQKKISQKPITISFEHPAWIAADIDGLISGIESHWDYAVFLFQQSKMDRFLAQFDKEWVSVCKNYRRLSSGEDALFRLTLDLSNNNRFVWKGKIYQDLLEMEETWERDKKGENDITSFLQRGHVAFYLKKQHAVVEQIEFVERLQDVSRIHPFEACSRLFQALRGNDGMNWENVTFNDLGDVVRWLKNNIANLDEEITKMFKSKRFEAWLAYQGMENVLEEIRRKCEV